jgi:hypothetical protein
VLAVTSPGEKGVREKQLGAALQVGCPEG